MYSMQNLSMSFGNINICENLSIEFSNNQITSIMAPSGSGKTTLLDIMAGLKKADSGHLRGFEGKKISYIFQEDRLFDFMTLRENISLVGDDNIDKYLKILDIYEYKDMYPHKLSGGIKKRAGIVRALAYKPDLILSDEAFGALDLQNEQKSLRLIKDIVMNNSVSVINVTHDVDNALNFSDEIVILSDKPMRILDICAPKDINQEKLLKILS